MYEYVECSKNHDIHDLGLVISSNLSASKLEHQIRPEELSPLYELWTI